MSIMDRAMQAIADSRLYLVGDENGDVGIHCHDCFDGGLPLAHYDRNRGPAPVYQDADVLTVTRIQGLIEEGSRHLVDAHSKTGPIPKSKRAAAAGVVGKPRLFANEIQDILRELDLAHVVAKINATARPEPDSHNAMIFLTDQATDDTSNQLADAFTARGWLPSIALSNTKIYVYVRAPDKRSAPSGEAMRRGEHGC